jgi:hypothetical protein
VSAATGTAHLARHGSLRRELEGAVQPVATSIDGRRFTLQAPLAGSTLQPGGYVMLGDRLGEVTALRLGEAPGPEHELEDGRARRAEGGSDGPTAWAEIEQE